MRFAANLALIALVATSLSACQREQADAPLTPAVANDAPTPPASASIEGWRTEEGSFPLLGQTAPAFTAPLNEGGEVTQEALRGRWTILAFWGLWSDDSLADARYIAALVSAAGQDPDLDVLTIHTPPGPGRGAEALGAFLSLDTWFADQGPPWATAMDSDGAIAAAYGVTDAPVYLLVGPDLTIEGWREDLSATPDDGIKSVIRGVADIRKEIAAPE